MTRNDQDGEGANRPLSSLISEPKKRPAGVPCLPLRAEGNLPAGEIRCRQSNAYWQNEPPLSAGGLARETKTGAALISQGASVS